MYYNKQKLYKSIMESVAKTVKHALNEDNTARKSLNLRGDFAITRDNVSSGSIKAFIASAARKKQLSLEDEMKLANIIQNSTDQKEVQNAKNTLVEHNLLLSVSVANRYTQDKVSKEDLIQLANLGLIEAAGTYNPDPNNPNRFSAYAIWYMRRYILRELEKLSGAYSISKNGGSIRRAAQRFINRYEAENGYAPDFDEILDELHKNKNYKTVTMDLLKQVMASNLASVSTDATMSNDDDSKSTIGDGLTSNTFGNPDSGLNNKDLENELEDALIRVLGPRDADIVCNFYGIAGRSEMSPWKLADKWNLTDTRINQILRASEQKMSKDEETRQLLQYINA